MSISEVAKRAGVSSSTVSRVINNHPRVAPETAQSVRRVMKELGYTPSDRRPGPKPSRPRIGTGTIAFLVLGTSGERATPAFEDLLRGVSMGAFQNHLKLVFTYVPDPEHLPQILEQRFDGVLLHGALPGPELRDRLRNIPTVWVMGNRRRPDWGDQVMPSAYEIGELAANYLVKRGHRHLAYLNLDAAHRPLRIYGQSFVSEAAELQAEAVVLQDRPKPSSSDYRDPFQSESVERLVQQFLALVPRPTGVFVAEDMQVAMIQPALQSHGVEIGPGKTELISCNNEKPYYIGLSPKPAVIDIRAEAIGRRGVDQLLWRLAHPEVQERIIATVEPFIVTNADSQPAQTAEAATLSVH